MDALTISIPEAAKATSLSRTGLYRLINRGELEAVRVGGRTLIKAASLRRLVGAEVA